jgi:hypothetical protein
LFLSADSVTASAPADTSLPAPETVLQAWSDNDAAKATAIIVALVNFCVCITISPDAEMRAANAAISSILNTLRPEGGR